MAADDGFTIGRHQVAISRGSQPPDEKPWHNTVPSSPLWGSTLSLLVWSVSSLSSFLYNEVAAPSCGNL
jgi:hypothetical protein